METHSVEAGHDTGLLLWARNKSSKKELARHVPDTGRGNSKRHQAVVKSVVLPPSQPRLVGLIVARSMKQRSQPDDITATGTVCESFRSVCV